MKSLCQTPFNLCNLDTLDMSFGKHSYLKLQCGCGLDIFYFGLETTIGVPKNGPMFQPLPTPLSIFLGHCVDIILDFLN